MLLFALLFASAGDLIELAQAGPAEFYIETLLRSGTKDMKVLLDAERRLPEVEMDYPLTKPFGLRDDLPYRLARASLTKLDRLTLNCRLVEAMLDLDRKQARAMFERMGPPQFRRSDCETELPPQAGQYIRTLRKLADAQILESHLRGLSSIALWGPLLSLVAERDWPASERGLFIAILAEKLESLPLDFGSGVFGAFGARAVDKLGDPELSSLWQKRFDREMKAPRCEFYRNTPLIPFDNLPPHAEPIRWVPRRTRPSASLAARGAAVEVLRKRIVFGEGERALPLAKRETQEWERDARELLIRAAASRPSKDDNELLYFHNWCDVFEDLLQFAPPGGEAGKLAAREAAAFLSASPVQKQHPAHWWQRVDEMLRFAREFTDEKKRQIAQDADLSPEDAPNANGPLFLAELEKSPSVSAQLAARLERVAPLKRER